jgi:hypothetical protein
VLVAVLMLGSETVAQTFDGYLVEGWEGKFLYFEERYVVASHTLGMMGEIGWKELGWL